MEAASDYIHHPVLLDEAVAALAVRPDGCYVDATFGRGGHATEIIKKLGGDGRLLAIDRDDEAVAFARMHFRDESRFSICQGAFSQLQQILEKQQLVGRVDGLLLDLGVSSPQLDDPERGFSFMREGALDMRMDRSQGLSASEWLDQVSESELVEVLRVYGEERFARRIARAVILQRESGTIRTTAQLADLIAAAVPRKEKHKHPATRSFQAIRIKVNRELDEIEAVLEQALTVLAKGARLVVISFHSLEDRIVKRFIRKQAQGERLPIGLPVQYENVQGRLRPVGKVIFPSAAEVEKNPRARSAVMRVAEIL